MIEPGTVFKEIAMIQEQKWESKFTIDYINEMYADGESTNIHRHKVTYANIQRSITTMQSTLQYRGPYLLQSRKILDPIKRKQTNQSQVNNQQMQNPS